MGNVIDFKSKIQDLNTEILNPDVINTWDGVKTKIKRDFVATGTDYLADEFIVYFEPIFYECIKTFPVPCIEQEWKDNNPIFIEIDKAIKNLFAVASSQQTKLWHRIYLLELEKYIMSKIPPSN